MGSCVRSVPCACPVPAAARGGSARGCQEPGAARSFSSGFQASQGPLSAVSSQGNLGGVDAA